MSHDSSSNHYLDADFDYASLIVYTPIAPPAANSYNGTHHSIMGVGGYMEVPTIDNLYDLTINPNLLNPDGYSSGKRRVGMIVYVLENAKYLKIGHIV